MGVTAIPYDSGGNANVTRDRAVTGQKVLAAQVNVPFDDVQSMLSQVILRSGVAPFSGHQSLAGFKMTNAADGSADGDYATMGQLNAVSASVVNSAPPGTVQGFRRKTAPSGWIVENGGTIGAAASGATARANADTLALYTVLWTEFTNAELVIQDGAGVATTRGASAAADFSANKRMPLFDSSNRFHRGSGTGLVVGVAQDDAIKSHTHTGTTEIGGGTGARVQSVASATAVSTSPIQPTLLTLNTVNGTMFSGAVEGTPHTHTFTTAATGDTETRPKASAVLYCIKL